VVVRRGCNRREGGKRQKKESPIKKTPLSEQYLKNTSGREERKGPVGGQKRDGKNRMNGG